MNADEELSRIDEAADTLGRIREDLGEDVLQNMLSAMDWAEAHPEAWVTGAELRRRSEGER